MSDREKVISTFEKIISVCKEDGCDFVDLTFEDAEQILALLKEQEEQKRKWLQNIADNQLANSPKHDRDDFMTLDEHLEYQYQLGVYDGLQMAYDILTEGR